MSVSYKILVFTAGAFLALSFGFNADAQTAPSVTTGEAVFIGARNAYLNAAINPNGSYTQVWFQIDTVQPPFGVRGYQGAGSGTSNINIQAGVINLKLDITYYYRAVAQNAGGLTYGETKTFKIASPDGSYSGSTNYNSNSTSTSTSTNNTSTNTSSSNTSQQGLPGAATNGPASVSANSAVINGSVNPNNANTTFWFRFGATQALDQTTTVQSLGSGGSWQLVVGNLSGLESGKTYYYRVIAQNNFGLANGDILSFNTGNQFGQTNQTGGQVLGAVSGNGNGSNTGTSTGSGSTSSVKPTSSKIVNNPRPKVNERPSFISLEYSIGPNGALVLVADDAKPKPGEEFNYTVVYKNDGQSSFNEAGLKVIIPAETEYLRASVEPIRISGDVVEFGLGNIVPGAQGAVVVTVKIKENVLSGANIIFTSVLGYKDRTGTQLATTSYMTTRTGQGPGTPLSASLGSLLGYSGTWWLVALALIVLLALLIIGFLRMRKKKTAESKKEDLLGFGGMPPTFQPVDPMEMIKR